MKRALFGALGVACLFLVGCAANGALNAPATADVATALSVGCPILTTVDALAASPNKDQAAALKTLALACPPNPPPTSAVVAVTDIIAAYTILQPLISAPTIKKSK